MSGWILIFETVGPNEERGLQIESSDATGNQPLPPWETQGWTSYASQMNTNGTASVRLRKPDTDDD